MIYYWQVIMQALPPPRLRCHGNTCLCMLMYTAVIARLTHRALGNMSSISDVDCECILVLIIPSQNELWVVLQYSINDNSKRVQVIACCCRVTSHCVDKCCPRSPTHDYRYRSRWVNIAISFCHSSHEIFHTWIEHTFWNDMTWRYGMTINITHSI